MRNIYFSVLRKTFAGAFAFGIISSCTLFNKPEEIPSYIHIDNIQLQVTNPGQDGSSSSKITDAWIFVDGTLIGGFELPCTVPVLASGQHHLLIKAGIKLDGAEATRAIYTYYKGYETDATLSAGEVLHISPVVQYYQSPSPILYNETFSGSGQSISDAPTANYLNIFHVDTTSNNPNSFEGNFGYATLNSDTTLLLIHNSTALPMDGGQDLYVELNYRCNTAFTVGVQADNPIYFCTTNAVIVNPSAQWNKIYIRLNEGLGEAYHVDFSHSYHIYIAMQYDPSQTTSWLNIDNFKILN